MTALRAILRMHSGRVLAAVLVALGLWALSQLAPQHVGEQKLDWLSLLPAYLAFGLVIVTRRVVLALGLAVVLGGLAHNGLNALPNIWTDYFWSNLDRWHCLIAGFALCTLAMVSVIESSNGASALVGLLRARLRTRRSVQLGAATAGLIVFFDDYANSVLVGSSMRPLTDRYGISRQKLAYIVDSTAAPVAGLALISTWVSYEIGLIEEVSATFGLSQGGYSLLIQALPLRFYCLLSLALVFLSSAMRRDLGPMAEAERHAFAALAENRKLTKGASSHPVNTQRSRLLALNAALPIGALIGSVGLGYIYDGGGLSTSTPLLTGAWWQAILANAKNGDIILFSSALIATTVAAVSARCSRQLDTSGVLRALGVGVRKGMAPLSILFCAWALSSVSKDLQTGAFLVASLHNVLPATILPFATFLVAAAVAGSTGTSWGTMAILLPAALPLAHQLGGTVLTIATIAAVLDGAIFGDHCSPMSDTTVLSATACQCDVVSHTWTQLPYALLAMLVASLCYLSNSLLGLSPVWLLVLGIAALALALKLFGSKAPAASHS